MRYDANARAEAVVLAWQETELGHGRSVVRLSIGERDALVRMIQRELVEMNRAHWSALAVLDPEGRFLDIEDAARNRMQVVVLAEDHTAKCSAERERLEAEVERLKSGSPGLRASLDEALNSGDGTYRP